MAISLTNESKSKVSLTNESRPQSPVLDDIDALINDSDYLINSYKAVLNRESKSKISLSNESK